MGTTLDHGIYLPDEGERNCYDGLAGNWVALDNHLGSTNIHVTINDKQAWNGHVADTTIHVTSADKQAWNGHVADLVKHVTAADKAKWDAVTSKADDSDVVHKSGNETIGGIKSFSDDTYIKSLNFTNEVPSPSSSSSSIMPIIATITYGDSSPAVQARLNLRVTADGQKSLYPHDNNVSLGLATRVWSDFFAFHGYFRGQQQNDEYSSNARTNLTLLANRDTLGQSGCLIDTFRGNTSQGTALHILGFGIKENSVRYEGVRLQWIWNSGDSGYDFNLKPTTQGTNKPLTYNLGTSADKWDSINGVEPSSLSLPSGNTSNFIDISSYLTHLDGIVNTYTAPANGWISITMSNCSGIQAYITGLWGHQIVRPTIGGVRFLMPILKDKTANILIFGGTIEYARFIPCQGNV